MNKRGTMLYPEEDNRYIPFTPEQLQALADMYRAGQSTRSLSRRYGISPTTVQRRLQSMGVELRGLGKPVVVTDEVLDAANRMRSIGTPWKSVEAATGVKSVAIRSAIRRKRSKQLN